MKSVFTFVIFICFSILATGQNTLTKALLLENSSQLKKSTFEVSFAIFNSEHPSLAVTIILDEKSYLVSPNSKDDIYGKYGVSLLDSSSMEFLPEFAEFPISKPEYDNIIKEEVNFVRDHVTYTHSIKLKKKSNFKTKGKVWILVEPECKPYQIEFTISQSNGVLAISKGETKLDL